MSCFIFKSDVCIVITIVGFAFSIKSTGDLLLKYIIIFCTVIIGFKNLNFTRMRKS